MKKVLLSLSSIAIAASSMAQDCSKIFISEYVEGFGNNKAIEIYNPTNQAVNLNEYFLQRYNNGNGSSIPQGQNNAQTIQLPTAVLQPYDTYVIVLDRNASNSTESDPKVWDELYNMADAHLCSSYSVNNAMNFNGNDAMVLGKGNAAVAVGINHTLLDIIGKIGEDPGGNGTGGWSTVYPHNYSQFLNNGNTADVAVTLNHSLIRKPGVKIGYTNLMADFFNPLAEWDSIPPSLPKRDANGDIVYQNDGVTPQWVGNWSSLGWHTCDCAPLSVEGLNLDDIKLYPNPTTGVFTISGLEKVASLELINSLGQTIKTIDNNTQSTVSFDLSEKSGVYIVKVTDHNGRSATQKVIVK